MHHVLPAEQTLLAYNPEPPCSTISRSLLTACLCNRRLQKGRLTKINLSTTGSIQSSFQNKKKNKNKKKNSTPVTTVIDFHFIAIFIYWQLEMKYILTCLLGFIVRLSGFELFFHSVC